MAVTVFPNIEDSPDLTLLNVSRLFTRLEHNLLAPGTELRTLRKSEFQRMRVTKNVEYARNLLSQLERSLPQLKQLDRRHEAQTEIFRDRQLLKRIQNLLDEEDARAEKYEDEGDEDAEEVDDEWKELFAKPVKEERVVTAEGGQGSTIIQVDGRGEEIGQTERSITSTTTATSAAPTSTPTQTPEPEPASTLRNRLPRPQPTQPVPSTKTTTSNQPAPSQHPAKLRETEHALDAQRSEQEDLTSSLLALASQLKTSSQSFQSTLENEKSVLDRAVSGIDKTSTTMEAAGKRMGMLRKMSEGKGWWGRMMLYAWIFGLWVAAILIVFVGPKMRF